jgi:hypothetical protein
MKITLLSLAAIVAVTAATSPELQRRADPILEFNCKDFPEVCKTQCYGKRQPNFF